MPHHPLQHTSITQARHYHSQHTRNDNGSSTEARAHLLGIENACGKQHTNSDKHDGIGSHFRHQHHNDNSHHRGDGYPGIYAEAPQ